MLEALRFQLPEYARGESPPQSRITDTPESILLEILWVLPRLSFPPSVYLRVYTLGVGLRIVRPSPCRPGRGVHSFP